MTYKAPETPCRACGTTIPPQPSGPGRPRRFCSDRCRRRWHHRREQEREQTAKREEAERRRYETDRRLYGERRADQLARERQKR